jgi:hypothetical protein
MRIEGRSEHKTISPLVNSDEMAERLKVAGLLPVNTKRFIIDCDAGKPVKIYYECFSDAPTLDVVFGCLTE